MEMVRFAVEDAMFSWDIIKIKNRLNNVLIVKDLFILEMLEWLKTTY